MKFKSCLPVLLALGLLTGCGSSDADLIQLAQKSVQQQLKDPESAKFGEALIFAHPDESPKYKNLRYVCGTVNAKNALGGYVGESRFVVLLGLPSDGKAYSTLDSRLEGSPGDNVFTITVWNVDCKKNDT